MDSGAARLFQRVWRFIVVGPGTAVAMVRLQIYLMGTDDFCYSSELKRDCRSSFIGQPVVAKKKSDYYTALKGLKLHSTPTR